MTNSPSDKVNAELSLGVMLQQARMAKKVSLETASGELFILKRHLQALEDEDFAQLPQAAFARGFTINYAKFLDLDPAVVASSFDRVYPDELKPQAIHNTKSLLRPMGTLQRDNQSQIRFNPLLIIAVIGLIVLAVFLFRMVTDASQNNQEPARIAEDVTASEQTQGAAISNVGNSIGASGSALNLGSEAATTASLQLMLTADTSIGIIDANGSSLMSGEQIAGEYSLSGVPPFDVVIDDINNVNLLLNQQTVSLEQYATGKQASFALMP